MLYGMKATHYDGTDYLVSMLDPSDPRAIYDEGIGASTAFVSSEISAIEGLFNVLDPSTLPNIVELEVVNNQFKIVDNYKLA